MRADFSFLRPIDKTLSGVTSSGQRGSSIDGNKGVGCIPQSSTIIGASQSDWLVSYLGHLLVQSVYLLPQSTGVKLKENRQSKNKERK